MQPGQGYTQDDFSQPAFCRACGTHVPKSFLATTGGLCANCLRNLQQMQMPGPNPTMAYPGQYRPARPSFLRSTGFAALLVGLVACGLLFLGASRYLKLPSIVGGGHRVTGVSEDLAKSSGSLVDQPIDDAAVADLKSMAAKEIDDAFGPDVANPWEISTQAIRNKLTNETTYYAGGDFYCIVAKDREHVLWKIAYVRDEQGKWRMLDRQAWYQTDDGYAQFDFDVKKFIHLVH
jgi:hypothetical protein